MSRNRRRRNRRPQSRLLLKLTLLAGVLLLISLVFAGIAAAYLMTRDLPRLEDPNRYRFAQTSMFLKSDGSRLYTLSAAENRYLIPLGRVPKNLRNAIIAYEDQRFYKHKGIDYEGILRALFADIASGKVVEGGSTISQQYVKNIYVSRERSFSRKVKEAALAWQLEKTWTKNKILESYVNAIFFGHNAYGVQAAAITFFSKPVTKLNLAECALLAALPRSPVNYSPFLHPAKAKARRNIVIKEMLRQRFITGRQARWAYAQPLGVRRHTGGHIPPAPHYIDYLTSLLIRKMGRDTVYKGGLKIFTTIDLQRQAEAERAVASVLDRPGDPEAALVAIDPRTGRIEAMVGGSDYRRSKFNLATQAHRQPGSSFKTFVLVTAIKDGFTLSRVYESKPQSIDIGYGEIWKVKTYSNTYAGKIDLLTATEKSDNTVYAQLAMDVGPSRISYTAQQMGIKTHLDDNPAMALGGLGMGVTPLEMASAYATLASRGIYREPTGIDRVTTADGRLIWRAKLADKAVMSPEVADIVNYALSKVVTDGTGTQAQIGRPVAGKTGTTSNYRDAWFVGYTPDLVCCVWVGYPTRQVEMSNVHGMRVAGGNLPAMIWARFMSEALAGTPARPFNLPDKKIVWTEVCSESGMLATRYCPHSMKQPFIASTVPTKSCIIHKSGDSSASRLTVRICLTSGKKATAACPADQVRIRYLLPAEMPGSCDVHGRPRLQANAQVAVPNVVGRDQDSALSALRQAGFQVRTSRMHSSSPASTVFSQSPAGGSTREQGSLITIAVSDGP